LKNIIDSLDDIMKALRELDKKLDSIIDKNSPPKDVVDLFEKIKKENVV